jgi:hypothetical protein
MTLGFSYTAPYRTATASADAINTIPPRCIGNLKYHPNTSSIFGFESEPNPRQHIRGKHYDWFITPCAKGDLDVNVGETKRYWPDGVIARELPYLNADGTTDGRVKSSLKTLHILNPNYILKRYVGDKFTSIYSNADKYASCDFPSKEEAFQTIPYYAYPLVIPISIPTINLDTKGSLSGSYIETEMLALIGGLINVGSSKTPQWKGTNTILFLIPTTPYAQKPSDTKKSANKWEVNTEIIGEGLQMRWYNYNGYSTKKNTAAFGQVGAVLSHDLGTHKTHIQTMGGLKYNVSGNVFEINKPTSTGLRSNHSYNYGLDIDIKIDLADVRLQRFDTGESHNILDAKIPHVSFEWRTRVDTSPRWDLLYIKTEIYMGTFDEKTGLLTHSTDNAKEINHFPLLFPYVFRFSTGTETYKPVFYGSMGFYDQDATIKFQTPDNKQLSVLLKNYCVYDINDNLWVIGHPLLISAGVGALDGCVAFHDETRGHVTLLGGRQIDNNIDGKNYCKYFLSDTTHTDLDIPELELTPGKRCYVQPYGMTFNLQTLIRKKQISKPRKRDTIAPFNFIHDTLPYAALYSDALKFPGKDAWLLPCSALFPQVNVPMLIIESVSWSDRPKDETQIDNDFGYYIIESILYRITPLLDKDGFPVKVISSNPNISKLDKINAQTNIHEAIFIGRGLGDHGIRHIKDKTYEYYNLPNNLTIEITFDVNEPISFPEYMTWTGTELDMKLDSSYNDLTQSQKP